MPQTIPATTLPDSEELQVHALALKLLGMAFYLPPSEPFVAELSQGDLLAEWPLQSNEPAAQGSALLRTFLASADAASLLPALRDDFIALFIGPDHVTAPPWESVYLSRDHLMFDAQTLQVREQYARFGLEIPHIDREPDDHVGFELLFLSHLAELAAQAIELEQPAEALRYLEAAHRFLAEHLQQWIGLFAERLERHARTDYFRGLGQLLLGSVAALDDLLREAQVSSGDAE